jgi:hypothetical protein
MIFTPIKDLKNLNEGAGGFVKGTAEFLSQMSKFRLTLLDEEWINAILNNTPREDIPNAYKKILNELSIKKIEIEKDRKQQKVVNDALSIKKRYMGKYKQWKNGELPGKALISELKPVIEYMENASKIFEGEQIDKSGFQFPFMVETGQELVSNILNYLRAFYDELKQENTAKSANEESLPVLDVLEKLTEGKTPILRKWNGGKYKCVSLEKFIKAYNQIVDNLTPALIRDYLISDRTGKAYSDHTIETYMKLYGVGRQ